jgi:hypothetical protein
MVPKACALIRGCKRSAAEEARNVTKVDDGELRLLQARAYGPHADIQFDADALRRLRELEGKSEPRGEITAGRADAAQRAPVPEAAPAALEPADALDALEPLEPTAPPKKRRPGIRLDPRLIAALALAAAIVVAALLVHGHVRSVPLQAGTTQVARLHVAPDYQVPGVFGSPDDGFEVAAFEPFHGVRPIVIGAPGAAGMTAGDKCIGVYPEDTLASATSNSFEGPAWSGCGAGAFPAAVQLGLTTDLPAELRSAFPKGTALQFVYDKEHKEVVVFADK